MKFLNCNYPARCKMMKGKPKELKSNMFKMQLNGATLIEQKPGVIWFIEDSSYYWGIELDIKRYNGYDINIPSTLSAVNLALLNWHQDTLTTENQELLYRYLRILK